MAHKIAAPFPIFPASLPPSRRHGAATEVRFSRWNNANAQPFIRRQREQQEIEDDIRRHRRHHSAARIAEDPDAASAGAAAPPSSAVDFKSRGTPSSPSSPSIPGKASKYSKPQQPPKSPRSPSHPAFRRIARATGPARLLPEPGGETGISMGESGISYRIKDAPFEFQYSYTETPKVRPLALREPPFMPFGPTTMPRPWTGRAPLPPSKKKLPEFDSFKLPPPGKKGVKPVQAPGPFLAGSGPRYTAASRDEILGDPLTEEEVKDLVKGSLKTRRQLNMGRDGLTHNMLDNIHAHWKRKRVCKIKCKGVCTVDMDNVRQHLEEKTGGKIIYNKGGVIFLFRGRNYNYRTRPRFPLMLWKPITPVYPRLVQKVPEGLTLEEASEMRKKGHKLPPICKLGKNGLYSGLFQHVREAFEECELVRIDCKGMNNSDCRKIGAKLKDLVPCVLLSFAYEHILMWRGKDWKSSLPPPEGNHNESVGLVADGPTTTSPRITESDARSCSNELNLEIPSEKVISVEDVGREETEGPSSSETMDHPLSLPSTDPTKMTGNAVDSSTTVNREPLSSTHQETPALITGKLSDEDSCFVIPCQSISLDKCPNLEGSKDFSLPESEPQLLSASSGGGNSTRIENSEAVTRTDGIDSTDGPELIPTDSVQCQSTTKSTACLDRVMLLLRQAVESGSAVVLDDEYVDANIAYERSVALANTAPPGPVFQQRIRRTVVQKTQKVKSEKYEEQDVGVEAVTIPTKEKRGNERKNSRSRRREDLIEVLSDGVPHGSLRVDQLAKLLA